MVVPFSNTKLRVPSGFQSLLVGLSTEVLRSQPRNIHAFAADYFEKLLKRREGKPDLVAKQTALEDRYYNNSAFQEEYSVNDPEVNSAATKIQASFRGKQARKDVERMKNEKNFPVEKDDGDLDFVVLPKTTEQKNYEDEDEEERPPSGPSYSPRPDENDVQTRELTFEEEEQERRANETTAVAFRAPFQKSPSNEYESPRKSSPSQMGTGRGPSINSPPQSHRFNDEQEFDDEGQNHDGIVHDSSRMSDDFERHTELPQDTDFQQEQDDNDNQDDLDDPNMEKAATKIQASFRGYKTRKDLASSGQSRQDQPDEQMADREEEEQEEEEQNYERDAEPEDEDAAEAAAVKIQAAFRGYRTRRELDKPETE